MLTTHAVSVSRLRRGRTLFVSGAVLLCCLVCASAAQAAPSLVVSVDMPATMQVGQTNLAGSMSLTTAGTLPPAAPLPDSPGGTAIIGVCNTPTDSEGCADALVGSPWNRGILLTPTCAQTGPPSLAASSCTVADPNVVAMAATASGSGSACAGTTFDVTMFDAARGTVRFTPRPPGSRVWLGAPGSTCVINFTFSVLKAPADAAPGTAGTQTRSIATAGGEWNWPSPQDPHYKPEPLRDFAQDLTTVPPTCPPGTIGTPPNCTVPACPPGTVGTPPDCTVPPCAPPMVGTPPDCTVPPCAPPMVGTPPDCTVPPCVPPMTGTPPDCRQPLSRVMSASLSGSPRCSPTNPVARAVREAFPVTVTVGGALSNVSKVEFRQNGRLIKTLRRATNAQRGQFQITINPSALAPKPVYLRRGGKIVGIRASRMHSITAKVTLRAGTFVSGKLVRTQSLPKRGSRPITFRAVGACSVPPPPSG